MSAAIVWHGVAWHGVLMCSLWHDEQLDGLLVAPDEALDGLGGEQPVRTSQNYLHNTHTHTYTHIHTHTHT